MSLRNLLCLSIGIFILHSVEQIFTKGDCELTRGDCVGEDKRCTPEECSRIPHSCRGYKNIDKFGKELKYQCHCRKLKECTFKNFNKCPNGCLPGYKGPYCQRRKYHEFIKNSSLTNDSHLFNSANNVTRKPFLKLHLGNTYRINTVRIHCEYPDSTMQVIYPDKMQCKVKRNTNITTCSGDITTDTLNISGNASIFYLELFGCPHQLYGKSCTNKCHCINNEDCHQLSGICANGCEPGWYGEKCDEQTYINIALRGNTSHISSWGKYSTIVYNSNGTCAAERILMTSDKAVDGNYDPEVLHKTCSVTDFSWDPYWVVKLDKAYMISQIRIYNENDNRGSLDGFIVYLDRTLCFHSRNEEHKNLVIPIVCYQPVNATRVWIRLLTTYIPRSLTLCEVEVIQCRLGFYGNMCSKRCPECEGLACNQSNGHCEKGCAIGYYKDMNSICKECPSRKFGRDCLTDCHCSEPCNHINGTCPGSCHSGYIGADCQKECDEGQFGVNCNSPCHCVDNKNCDKRNGTCSDGCTAGYQGESCQQNCPNGTFGIECLQSCRCSQKCDHIDGYCPGACFPGYEGQSCQKECDDGQFGVNCNSPCHCVDNKNCDKRNGTCSDGCTAGYQGESCQQKERKSKFILIIGIVAAFLFFVLVVVIIIGICCWKKQSKLKIEDKILKVPENGFYENIAHNTDHVRNEEDQNENECIYMNMIPNSKQPTFLQYVMQRKQEAEPFKLEFEALADNTKMPCTEATKPENARKNRYKAILPYDHSRVKLQPDDVSSSDYINANFINNKRYVACQGPTENTVADFWKMVWQLKGNTIVMLTDILEKGKVKCMQYWPDSETAELFGDTYVSLSSVSYNLTYIYRTFAVSKSGHYENEVRTIHHFLFNNWPDHDVPEHAEYILEFRNAVKHTIPTTYPQIIHCSAGVGRSGTYICLDILLNENFNDKNIDVMGCIRNLRKDRMHMVQKRIQLEFIYDVLVANILTGNYDIQVSNIPEEFEKMKIKDNSTGLTILEQQFKDVVEDHQRGNIPTQDDDFAKFNLKTTCINGPACTNEFLLINVPGDDDDGFIVNFLNCIHKKYYFTIVDFLDSNKKHSMFFLPKTLNECVRHGRYRLKLVTVEDKDICIHSVVKVTCYDNVDNDDDDSNAEEFEIHHLLTNIWIGRNFPSCSDIFNLSTVLSSHQNAQTQKQIALCCRETSHKAGLLCIIHLLKATIPNQSVINIVRLARLMKKIQPETVADCASYNFIWQLAVYIQTEFSLYSNVIQ